MYHPLRGSPSLARRGALNRVSNLLKTVLSRAFLILMSTGLPAFLGGLRGIGRPRDAKKRSIAFVDQPGDALTALAVESISPLLSLLIVLDRP